MYPETLMNGPRGRRVCLAFAMQADDDVDSTAEAFADVVDQKQGAVRYTSFRHTISRRAASGKDAEPGTMEGSVASALERAELPEVTDKALWAALETAVDTAYYWQEPGGCDMLTLQPEVIEPLARVARHLAQSPSTDWWSELMASEQWTIEFADPVHADDEPDLRAAEQILEDWHREAIDEKHRSSRNLRARIRANIGGDWWSMPPAALTSSTRARNSRGPVGLYLVEDSFGLEHATVTSIEPAGTVYEIGSPEAFAELCRKYPLDVTATRRHDWFRVTARDGRWGIPDWQAVSKDWDAVHLTIAAYLETAGRTVDVDGDVATVMAGWEPDATYWLTDRYALTGTSANWRYDDAAEIWRPSET